MNDGGRYSIQSPILSNLPPTRPTLSPPFTPFPGQHFPHHPVDLRPRDPGHLFSPKPVAGSAEMLRPAGTGPRGDASPPKCGSRTRPAPRRFNFMAPFSAPGSVASMTRPVYPPGVSGSTPPVPVAGCAPWERQWQKTPARGRGPEPQSSGQGVITIRKQRVYLRSCNGAAGGARSVPPGYIWLRPAVRRPVVRTAVSTSGPPMKAPPSAALDGPVRRLPRRAAWAYLAGIVGISHLPTVMISGSSAPAALRSWAIPTLGE